MKKQLLLFVMLLLPIVASAEAVEIDGIYYNLITKVKQAEITSNPHGYYSGSVIIPETVTFNGTEYKVTSIGEKAFRKCTGLTSIAIPNSITSIGDDAFWNCSSLTSVHISDIAAWCAISFASYSSNPLETAQHLFFNGEEIKKLVIPNGVTSIGDYAFSSCRGLTSITIPNSVTSIGVGAFSSCTGLTSVTIPNGVTSIGVSAFGSCTSLSSVTIPNSVISISGFDGCTGLNSITIPNSVESIDRCAFWGCTGLTSIIIPNSVTSIGVSAFRGCSGLSSVTIPNSVTSIDREAFSNCTSLTSITIPNKVTSIEGSTFYGCSKLTSITIGTGIKTIDYTAFANCPELTDVYCYAANVPNTQTSAFDGSYIEYATLHVPVASINTYKEIEPWKKFKNIEKINMPEHTLTYIVDGEVYKKYQQEEGTSITPEPVPTKKGYTFGGWSEIPATMPANDVTVTGTFSINKYKLTYMVDGGEYKSYDLEYGATITPEAVPTKVGYTFSGWSEIPTTMPAHDVIISGKFSTSANPSTLISDFEWLEENNKVEVVIGEPYQLKFSCSDNSLPFTSDYTDSWVHYDFAGGQHVVSSPTGYSIDDNGIITGLKAGSYAIKFTGWIQAKSGADKWLYITVVTERKEKESNNTLNTANVVTSKIRFGLYNTSDIDYFKYTNSDLKWGDKVTFKIHYYGTRENPFGYKWATFSGTSMSGGGSLISQDQECNALVTSGNTVYLEVYYDQSRSQYFNYGEEFEAEVYINGVPVGGVKKCATPTISYGNKKLLFDCDTEGVEYISEIKVADEGKYTDSEIPLSATYEISVYATKSGYEDSEVATATLVWTSATFTENTPVTAIQMMQATEAAKPILIQNNGGLLSIQGVDDDTPVSVYTVNGTEAGSSVSNGGQAQVNTNLQPGTVAIVKIGEKSVKVVMK